MRFLSFSEYEFGFIAVGGMPTGVIAIGGFPVGLIAIGIVPFGLISAACGAGVGVLQFTCGIGAGTFVRACGIGIGSDAQAVGLGVSLGGRNDPPVRWISIGIVTLAVLAFLWPVASERIGITKMNRVVSATWDAEVVRAEGIYLEPKSSCVVQADLRSDGNSRLHSRVRVRCGSLVLFDRHLQSACSVKQVTSRAGNSYALKCAAKRRAATSDEDSHTPERPGLELDTEASPGYLRTFAQGPPPSNIELRVEPLSKPEDGTPLLHRDVQEIKSGWKAPWIVSPL